ncbi:MAG: S24/S26 family peptidase [Paludibacteraceae bacterium]|nr:S24/S26 family peptidase [Paludibacteraceae bacterium]
MRVANDILIPELARLLSEGKEVRFTPSGVSMRPFIEGDKDSVILESVTNAPRRGDIILAQVQTLCGRQTYVLHRLVRIEDDTFVLQGDGNLGGEEYCKRADIIGRVKRIESPKGRKKPITRGYLWFWLKPVRKWLLKIYRHTYLRMMYDV